MDFEYYIVSVSYWWYVYVYAKELKKTTEFKKRVKEDHQVMNYTVTLRYTDNNNRWENFYSSLQWRRQELEEGVPSSSASATLFVSM